MKILIRYKIAALDFISAVCELVIAAFNLVFACWVFNDAGQSKQNSPIHKLRNWAELKRLKMFIG